MIKHRVEWIDVAKGMAIILVVLGHISFTPESLKIWLYSFHMPLFFFLAGITYNADKYTDIKVFIKNKIETLLIPYFIFVTIMWLWNAAWNVLHFVKDGTPLPFNTMIKQAIGIFLQIRTTDYGPGVWFLPCIFVAFSLLHFIIELSSSNVRGGEGYSKFRAMLFACACLIIGYIYCEYVDIKLPWGLDAAFIAVFFMTIGNILRDELTREIPKSIKISLAMVIMLALNITFAWLNYKEINRAVDMWSNDYGNLIFFIAGALSGIIFIMILSGYISLKVLKIIGSRSIYYYGFHTLIVGRICGYILRLPFMDNGFAKLAIAFVVVAVILASLSLCYKLYERLYIRIINRYNRGTGCQVPE